VATRDNYKGTDRVSVTIGTNYRSGSATVATTQEADEIWTVPLWPSIHERQETDSAYKANGMIRTG
jgi:hypothetical protein